jgi:hypothetical protein
MIFFRRCLDLLPPFARGTSQLLLGKLLKKAVCFVALDRLAAIAAKG